MVALGRIAGPHYPFPLAHNFVILKSSSVFPDE